MKVSERLPDEQAATIDDLTSKLDALAARMTTVEGDNTKLKADNTKLMEDNADLSARLVPLELASKICVADSVRNIAVQVVLFWAAVEPRKFPAGSRPVLNVANLRRSTAG